MVDVMVIGGEEDDATREMVERLNEIGVFPLTHETLASARWFEELKFCGCGDPEGVQTWLQRVLETLKGEPFVGWPARQQVLRSDPDASDLFVLYVLDAMGLTEHGGSVGGSWLTDKGRKFLADLETGAARRNGETT